MKGQHRKYSQRYWDSVAGDRRELHLQRTRRHTHSCGTTMLCARRVQHCVSTTLGSITNAPRSVLRIRRNEAHAGAQPARSTCSINTSSSSPVTLYSLGLRLKKPVACVITALGKTKTPSSERLALADTCRAPREMQSPSREVRHP